MVYMRSRLKVLLLPSDKDDDAAAHPLYYSHSPSDFNILIFVSLSIPLQKNLTFDNGFWIE